MTTVTLTGLMARFDQNNVHVESLETGTVTFAIMGDANSFSYIPAGAYATYLFFTAGGDSQTVTFFDGSGQDTGLSWSEITSAYQVHFKDVYWEDPANSYENLSATLMWFTDPNTHVEYWFGVDTNDWPEFSTPAEFESWITGYHRWGNYQHMEDYVTNQVDFRSPQGVYDLTANLQYSLLPFATVVEDDILNGTSGNDGFDEFGNAFGPIAGGIGNDIIHGLSGDDYLDGETGDDQLFGDDGNDLIDGSFGDDRVDGGVGDDRLFGGGGSDLLYGGAGNDNLTGGESYLGRTIDEPQTDLDDIILGGAGDDTITGSEGDDLLIGGAGIDTAVFRGMQVEYTVTSNANGSVTITHSNGNPMYGSDTLIGIEFARFSDATITLEIGPSAEIVGSDYDNTLTGTGIYDVLRGMGGSDLLTGGVGSDFIDGGAGVDTSNYANSVSAVNVYLNSYFGTTGGGDAQGDTLVEIENIIGSSFDDILSGDGVANVLTGGNGDDTIYGRYGNDILIGEDGNDTLLGGNGQDTLIGGDGNDSLIGGDTTSDLHDVIYGGNGNDTIDGGYGNDELRGDAGDDTIAGGFGADLVIGGTGNDVLTGSAYGDEIFGGDGNDFINGGFGHDRVNGGAGADKFYHLGIADHGSDWIQDYVAADGDVLMWGGGAATAADFLIQRAETASAGVAGVEEIFVTHIPTGNLLWALVDGDAQGQINIQIAGQVFDLLA